MTLHRPISIIARDITLAWANPTYSAKPYLAAMRQLSSINEHFGADDARSIVLHFLSNAASWRGPAAKELKAELRQITLTHRAG